MKATLVHVTDPFRPQIGRRVHHLSRRIRVDTLLRQQGMIAGRGRQMRRLSHFIVMDGQGSALLERDWKRCIHDGQVIAIIAVPAGGGIWRTLLTVGLVASAALVPVGWAGWGILARTGILLAGTALINAVLPPPMPAIGSLDNRSQNYGIGSDGNQARLGESVPVLYGRFQLTPNYAAQPYTEYDGNSRQTLYSLFCISQGDVDIEKILVGSTPIDQFTEVQYNVIGPGESCTLFPDNVVTSEAVSGVELKAPDDLAVTDGEWVGPYVTNPPATQATELAIDYGYPQGLYRINKNGKDRSANSPWIAQAQAIDDEENPLGDWFTLEQADEWMDNKQTSLYFTHRYTVPAGRYQVRMRKLQPEHHSGTTVNTLYWMGLRAYLPSKRTYGDCTLLEVKMQATSNLNSSTSHKINVLATRKLPIWDGARWSDPEPTQSIAWAAADILRNKTYGRGWDDSRIDLAGLLALERTWSQRGDQFNGIFDTKTTLWEALTSVLRCGRTLPIYYAGVVDFVRDQPQSVPLMAFTPQNIAQDSFSLQYAFPTADTADYVVVTYTDPHTWKNETVDCALEGSAKQTPKNVTLMGCTRREQAHREGMYMAACNRDQRKTVTVTTEMEGLIPRYGDLVDVSHDVPAWGLSGEVVGYDVGSGTFKLSEPVQWWPNQSHYLQLRSRNGGVQGPYQVGPGEDAFHVVLQGALDSQREGVDISDGVSEIPTIFQFGPGENYAQECLVIKAAPSSDGKVELTLANYAPSVHLAENNAAVPPQRSGSLLLNPSAAPSVGGVGIYEDPDSQQVWLSVDPVAGAVAYEFQVSYDGGNTWISVGVSNTNSIQVRIPAGSWIVRARAISPAGYGAWSQTPIQVTGAPPLIAAPAHLTATGGVFQILLTWQMPEPIDRMGADHTELWFGPTNDLGQASLAASVSLSANTYTLTNLPAGATYYFWVRIAGSDAGNYSPYTGPVAGESSSDATQILSYLGGQISKTELAQDLLSTIDDTSDQVSQQAAELQDQANQLSGLKDGITDLQQSDEQQSTQLLQLNNTAQNQQGQITTIQQTQGHQAEQLNSVQAKANPPSIGEINQPEDGSAGHCTTMASAGYYDYTIAFVDANRATTQRIDSLSATVDEHSASISNNAHAIADSNQSLAQVQQTLRASIDGNTTAVQTNAQAISNVNGRLDATYAIKVQATEDGRHYAAGIGVGVSNETGGMQSQVLFLADRLALLSNASGGATYTPFVIENGQTFINEAFIGRATINGAKISDELKSDSWDRGQGGIYMNFRTGYVHFTNMDIDGNANIQGNVQAHSISGQFQRIVQAQNENLFQGGTRTVVLQLDLPNPIRGDNQHTPKVDVSFVANGHSNNHRCIYGLSIYQDYNDGNWQRVRSVSVGAQDYTAYCMALNWAGSPTSSYTRYQLVMEDLGNSEHSSDLYLSSFYMCVTGIV